MLRKLLKRTNLYYFLYLIKKPFLLLKLRKKTILVVCEADFHYFHIEPLLKFASHSDSVSYTVLIATDFSYDHIKGIEYIDMPAINNDYLRTYDSCLFLEFAMNPWWLKGTTLFFILHGVGPKVSYFATDKLQTFDVVLAPGPYVKSKQLPFIRSDAKIVDAGLPITEELLKLKAIPGSNQILDFKNDKPTLLYAPSWCGDTENISINENILKKLATQNACNVIIRPHPRLLNPDACGGKDWGEIMKAWEKSSQNIKIYSGQDTSIYDILPYCALLMSDISSVIYEYMILERPVILYLKPGVDSFYKTTDYIELTKEACFTIDTPDELDDAINECLKTPGKLSKKQHELMQNTFYNPKNSIETIFNILFK